MLFRSLQRSAVLLNLNCVDAAWKMSSRPSSDLAEFRKRFTQSKYVVVLTGAGVSAESGVPTFRGAGGFWRKYVAQDLANPDAFGRDPSLVWEFYHYRRELVLTKKPNAAHKAIAECEHRLAKEGRKLVVVTQNIDELHRSAGTSDLHELHGSLFKVRCLQCDKVTPNRDSPICESLKGRGAPNPDSRSDPIPIENLPRCESCGGLLRPHVVWFGEALDHEVLSAVQGHLTNCDLCLVVSLDCFLFL